MSVFGAEPPVESMECHSELFVVVPWHGHHKIFKEWTKPLRFPPTFSKTHSTLSFTFSTVPVQILLSNLSSLYQWYNQDF